MHKKLEEEYEDLVKIISMDFSDGESVDGVYLFPSLPIGMIIGWRTPLPTFGNDGNAPNPFVVSRLSRNMGLLFWSSSSDSEAPL